MGIGERQRPKKSTSFEQKNNRKELDEYSKYART